MNKKFRDLKFSDDFMFCKVMQENEDICKGVVESILGFEIGGIVQLEGQRAIKITDDGHGVRFDIFMKDDIGRVYNIEMQTSNYVDIARRSRYYQSMLDRSLLEKGHSYRELNDSYIIFILLKDVFGLGYNVYEFESICTRETGLVLNDGAKRIFVNAERVAADSRPELRNLISYILDGKARDTLTERIDESVADARINPRMEGEFMTLWEMKEESYNEGIEKGMEVTALSAIPKILEKGISLEDACEIQGITVEKYHELVKQ